MQQNTSYNTGIGKKRSFVFVFSFALVTLLLLGSLIFGLWAYSGRQDYKTNVDKKIADAKAEQAKITVAEKDAEFAEKDKLPLKHYNGPAAYGSIDISYPRTWSAYVDETVQGSSPVNGYFSPNFVPSFQNQNSKFALRVEVSSVTYDQALRQFDSLITAGKIKVSAYLLPKVTSATGSRLDGEIITNKQGSMIILPLRDKTLKVWTESPEFINDFNTNILPNLTFIP